MSGPIVRTGTTPKYWSNWDQVFGTKKKATKKKATRKKAATKASSKGRKATKKAKRA